MYPALAGRGKGRETPIALIRGTRAGDRPETPTQRPSARAPAGVDAGRHPAALTPEKGAAGGASVCGAGVCGARVCRARACGATSCSLFHPCRARRTWTPHLRKAQRVKLPLRRVRTLPTTPSRREVRPVPGESRAREPLRGSSHPGVA